EVDQTLCVAVDHLGQVHDHRSAFAEVFTNSTRFIVSARMQCRNTGEIGSRRRVLGAPVGGLIAGVVITAHTDIGLVGLLDPVDPVSLVVVVLVLTVGVV